MDLIGTNISQSGFELVFESEGNANLNHQIPREKKASRGVALCA
jgi:hypothetical protein